MDSHCPCLAKHARRHPEVRALARLEGWPLAPVAASFEARREERRAPQDDETSRKKIPAAAQPGVRDKFRDVEN
jgi:hypothetical protein